VPLGVGQAVANVVATRIRFALDVAGDASSFAEGTAARTTLSTALEASLGCEPPACLLALRVLSGSVALEVDVVIPTEDATGASTAANITSAATHILAAEASELSATLGVDVLSHSTSADVQAGVTVPIVVAPPPPSPPPPSPTPRTPPVAPETASSGLRGAALYGGVGGGATAVALLIVLVVYFACFKSKRRENKTRPSGRAPGVPLHSRPAAPLFGKERSMVVMSDTPKMYASI